VNVRGDAFYNQYVLREGGSEVEDRVLKMLAMLPPNLSSILDIGCSEGRNLRVCRKQFPRARICGTDIGTSQAETLLSQGFEFRPSDVNQAIPFSDREFDVVLCGEVVEHLVDPDATIAEMRRVLKPGGLLVITTPNLAYIPNRLLLSLGVQPLFSETSLRRNYGRFLRALGQGNSAQGHLRIFTLSALLEMLQDHNFEIAMVRGYRWFQSGLFGVIDGVLAARPSFAAGFIVSARRPAE